MRHYFNIYVYTQVSILALQNQHHCRCHHHYTRQQRLKFPFEINRLQSSSSSSSPSLLLLSSFWWHSARTFSVPYPKWYSYIWRLYIRSEKDSVCRLFVVLHDIVEDLGGEQLVAIIVRMTCVAALPSCTEKPATCWHCRGWNRRGRFGPRPPSCIGCSVQRARHGWGCRAVLGTRTEQCRSRAEGTQIGRK